MSISDIGILFGFVGGLGLFLYAMNVMVKRLQKATPNSIVAMNEVEKDEVVSLKYLEERMLQSPSFAVENAILEVGYMGEIALENTKIAFEVARDNNIEKAKLVYENEKIINNLEKLITKYLVKINNLSLSEKQHMVINNLFYIVNDIERVGDHAENIAELTEFKCKNNIVFSENAKEDISRIMDLALKSIDCAVLAIKETNIEFVRKVVKYEDMVDNMEEEIREKHIERLSNGTCKPESGNVFLDFISNLERISDHAYNIAGYVKDEVE